MSGLPLRVLKSTRCTTCCQRDRRSHNVLLQVGDHCIEDGQKLVMTVTNATAGTLSGIGMLPTA